VHQKPLGEAEINLGLHALEPSNSVLSRSKGWSPSTHHHLPRRRRPATPPGTAAAEEKPLLECLSILWGSECRGAGATGGTQMKIYRLQLSPEEDKKLQRVMKVLLAPVCSSIWF